MLGSIGDRIRTLRRDREISMNELEDLIGASRGSVNKWEKGSVPGGNSLIALSTFFGVSTDWILKGQDDVTLTSSGTAPSSFLVRERESTSQSDVETRPSAVLTASLVSKVSALPPEKIELLHTIADELLKLHLLESKSKPARSAKKEKAETKKGQPDASS